MNDIYSFYQLISKYRIEIPIIQRDYAQGRDNVKAADVRKSLVGKLVNTVENENETLFFDFVYGRVDGDKFIPFDGQQRLTTLFLFHKFVFEKCQSVSDCRHKGNCICKDILGRFSYATRQSSREFCEKLVKHDVIPDNAYRKLLEENYKSRLKEDDKEKDEKTKNYIDSIDNWIYRFITNQPWFYPDWQKDPTVMGMLTMLDEIQNQMKGKDRFKNYAEKLTSGCNCPITFHFVDMGEHKLSDETYVKMNARGKQLTPFENFKASLEQYIEEKKKEDEGKQKTYDDLLNRLKGQYDETSNTYTGIDGTWLELFWEVKNVGGTEKELPDTLMMSFFNRHFMNVWRCWFVQHQNADNDKINRKIIDEMPLYPTKDDFVSWDVYNEILNKCGVEECLIPIFNIWDILCEKRFNYNNCCQAVWNRGTSVEEKKLWNFYTGITNNNNRETYPSRIAFYALLKFFKENDENSSETLARWMRVVWNIIENSTIDSSDTYHAALRLIEKLSNKSHNIYDALANHVDDFDLKGQYHAMEQVAEEIAKAKQIVDEARKPREYKGSNKKQDGSNYQTWEEIIEDAEKYAFFKGAIRFLFQDENGNVTQDSWNSFDKKWGNAKEYFDEYGVKDGLDPDKQYKTNSLLMKSLLANCDDFEHKIKNHFEFSNDAVRWRRILTSDKWRDAVDKVLSTTITKEITEKFVGETEISFIKNIIDDGLMDYICNEMSGAWIRSTYHGYHAIWQSGYPANQIVLNPILSKLQFEGKISYRNTEGRDSTIPNCRYYKCFDKNVDFKYRFNDKYYYFNWWGNPNKEELDVYLTEDNWPDYKYKKKPDPNTDKTDEDSYYCFRVTKEMEENITLFTNELERLIAKAGTSDSEKLICENCQEKICEQIE